MKFLKGLFIRFEALIKTSLILVIPSVALICWSALWFEHVNITDIEPFVVCLVFGILATIESIRLFFKIYPVIKTGLEITKDSKQNPFVKSSSKSKSIEVKPAPENGKHEVGVTYTLDKK